jgi:glycosyltransferase involved in cell wall biosynthesis
VPKLSIIVPVYNVEAYLPKCIDSILNQSFEDFELILINDGSTDKSSNICEYYREKDARVVFFQKENGGLSSARNIGLDYAKGEYVAFVDSDDWIDQSMYNSLILALEKNGCDIVICGHNIVNFDGSITSISKVKYDTLYSGLEATKLILGDILIFSFAWDKLYKRELFDGIRYPEGQIYEDTATTYKVFHKSTRVIQIEETFYFYVRRKDSLCYSTEKSINRMYDNFHAFKERYYFVLSNPQYDNVEPECERMVVTMGIGIIHFIVKSKNVDEQQFWKIANILTSIDASKNSLINKRLKIEICFLKLFPAFYRFLVRSFFQLPHYRHIKL